MAQIESHTGSVDNNDISEYVDAISFLSKELDDATQASIKLLERPWKLVLSSYFENATLADADVQDIFEKVTSLRVVIPHVDRNYYSAVFARTMPDDMWAADLSVNRIWQLCSSCNEIPKFIVWLSVSKRISEIDIKENFEDSNLVKYLVDLVKVSSNQSQNTYIQLYRMLGKSTAEMIAAVGIFMYRFCLKQPNFDVHFVAVLTLLLNRHEPSIIPPLMLWINLFLLLCTRRSVEQLQKLNVKVWIAVCEFLNAGCVKAGLSSCDLAQLSQLQDMTMSNFSELDVASLIADMNLLLAQAATILESHHILLGFLVVNFQSGRYVLGKQLLGTDANDVPSSTPSYSYAIDNDPNKSKPMESASDILVQIQALKLRKSELEAAVSKPKSSDSFIRERVFFLDTNILLDHFCSIRDLFHVPELQFILPLTVINEIDGLCHSDNEVRRKLAEGARLVISNPTARVQAITVSGIFLEAIEPARLDLPKMPSIKSNDDAIMHSVINYSVNDPDRIPVLISDDVNLALKCSAHGVEALPWRSFIDIIQDIYSIGI